MSRSITGLIIVLSLGLVRPQADHSKSALVADWKPGPRTENILTDESGNGIHGRIHGARLIKGQRGAALRFNGKTDYVDFGPAPGLKFTDSVTISAWVYLEEISAGQPIVVGRGPNFGLTQHPMTVHCVWYAVGHPRYYCSAVVGRGRWRHITATFDGKALRLYLDGQIRQTSNTLISAIDNSGEFRIGGRPGRWPVLEDIDRSDSNASFFKGVIGEIRIYRRALSEMEIQSLFEQRPGLTEEEIQQFEAKETRPTSRPGELSVRCYPYYFDRKVAVILDSRGPGYLPLPARASVALLARGKHAPLREIKVAPLPVSGEAIVWFTGLDLPSGDYQIRVTFLDRLGRTVGKEAFGSFAWPKPPSWPNTTPKSRILNSLVTELLKVTGAEAASKSHGFVNPRDGWVLFVSTAVLSGADRITLRLDSAGKEESLSVHVPTSSSTVEAMRWLRAGYHVVRVSNEGRSALRELVVRSIPELIFSSFPQDPLIPSHGPYDWNFLKKHILSHVNTIVLSSGVQHVKPGSSEANPFTEQRRPYVLEAKEEGKRWLTETIVPGMRRGNEPKATITAQEAYQFWAANPGFQQSLLDGVAVDEFHGGYPGYPAYTEALRKIRANISLKEKTFYADCGEIYKGELSRAFAQAVIDSGYRFSWERYLPEAATEGAARQLLDLQLRQKIQEWKRALPGCEKQMVINFGHYLSAFPETTNTDPAVDFKVYMEMMFYLLANDPSFFGLYGIREFTAAYADEEFIRWSARLFRHYCIEGRTSVLSRDPYRLEHIQNPDFDDGTRGWTLAPAELGGMTVKHLDGYGMLQDRYYSYLLPPDNGNYFLWTKRSARRANQFSQEIRNLQPGRLYSLKMVTGDYQDLMEGKSSPKKLAISIAISDVELLPSRCFQDLFSSTGPNSLGAKGGTNRFSMNYHRVVFRAKSPRARLSISDWAGPKGPGGSIGQEIIYNFIEVQPYLDR